MKFFVCCVSALVVTISLTGCSKPSDSTPQSVKQADGYLSGYLDGKDVSLDFYKTNFPTAYQACQSFGSYQLAELAENDDEPFWENWLTGCIDGLKDKGF